MRNRFFPIVALASLLILVLAGLTDTFDALSVPESSAGPGGPGIACEISPEGGTRSHYPVCTIQGAAHTAYLREGVTTQYNLDKHMWQLDRDRPHQSYAGGPLDLRFPDNIVDVVQDEMQVIPLSGSFFSIGSAVPTSLHTEYLSYPASLTYYPEEGVFFAGKRTVEPYSFGALHYRFDDSILREARAADDDIYLQLPRGLSSDIDDLADTITSGIDSPYEKAKAIERYLEQNYIYDENYARSQDMEPNYWFLFEEKKGVCANFNSAFVILCRFAGLPARLVSGYRITPQYEEQEVSADQAHVWAEICLDGIGWITFDATGSRVDVLPTFPTMTRTRTEIDEIVGAGDMFTKGEGFELKGTVVSLDPYSRHGWEQTYPGVPRDDGFSAYEWHLVTEDGMVMTDGVEIEGKPVADIKVAVYLSRHKMQGLPWDLDLYYTDLPQLSGAYLVGSGETSSEGAFEIGCEVPAEITAGHYHVLALCLGNEDYTPSLSDPEIDVVTDTSIALVLPQDVQVRERVEIVVALREEPSYWEIIGPMQREERWNPVHRQDVELYVDGKLVETGSTGGGGVFSVEYTFDEVRIYQVRAVFRGSNYHFASSREINVSLKPFPWFYLLIPVGLGAIILGYILHRRKNLSRLEFVAVVAVIVAGIACAAYGLKGMTLYPWIYLAFAPVGLLPAWVAYSLYRQRRRRLVPALAGPLSDIDIVAAPISSMPLAPTAVLKKAREGRIAIDFPQIRGGLPDVWGLNDDLPIELSLEKEEDGRITPSQDMEVYVDRVLLVKIPVAETGRGSLGQAFQSKGEYVIGARLGKARGQRLIRIVDYREEIVSLFNSLVERLRSQGVGIPPEATPREIQQIVLAAIPEIDATALDRVIGCFEEADYSEHPVYRRHYETMYLSQRALLERV